MNTDLLAASLTSLNQLVSLLNSRISELENAAAIAEEENKDIMATSLEQMAQIKTRLGKQLDLKQERLNNSLKEILSHREFADRQAKKISDLGRDLYSWRKRLNQSELAKSNLEKQLQDLFKEREALERQVKESQDSKAQAEEDQVNIQDLEWKLDVSERKLHFSEEVRLDLERQLRTSQKKMKLLGGTPIQQLQLEFTDLENKYSDLEESKLKQDELLSAIHAKLLSVGGSSLERSRLIRELKELLSK